MKDNVNEGVMFAVTIIALVVVIVAGFGVFGLARSMMNTGSDDLTETLDSINNSSYLDYDQTTVSGNKVLSALSDYQGSPVAVLIQTKAFDKISDGAKLYDTSGKKFKNPSDVLKDTNILKFTSDNANRAYVYIDGLGCYINYNAVLGGGYYNASGEFVGTSNASNAVLTVADGYITWEGGFTSINGIVQYYQVAKDYKTSGMTEYIAPGTRFAANLVKDASGNTIGVCFTQIN